MTRWRDDAGAAAAEFAVAVPAVVLVLALAVGAVTVSGRQVRLEQAAVQASRLAARGESADRVGQAASRLLDGVRISIGPEGDIVCVTASVAARTVLPLPDLRTSACALAGARTPGAP